MGSPMYQHIIGDKRASLSPAQRSRNGFCSTAGRRETPTREHSSLIAGPSTRKRSDFNPDAMRVRVDVGLGGAHTQLLHTAKSGDPLKDGMRERLLQIVAASGGDLFHLGTKKIIVPRARRIIVGGQRK